MIGFKSVLRPVWLTMAVISVWTSPARAEGSRFSFSFRYEDTDFSDLKAFEWNYPGSSSPLDVTSRFEGHRALGSLGIKTEDGFSMFLLGGVTVKSSLTTTMRETDGVTLVDTRVEKWNFGASPTMGVHFSYDLFPHSPVRLIPSLESIYTIYHGNSGTVTNTAANCSYTYAAGGATTCDTIAGNPADGTVETKFREFTTRARLELAWDVVRSEGDFGSDSGSSVTIRLGGEQGYQAISGEVAHVRPAATAVEKFSFTPVKPAGVFGGISFGFSGVQVSLEARAIGERTISGQLGYRF